MSGEFFKLLNQLAPKWKNIYEPNSGCTAKFRPNRWLVEDNFRSYEIKEAKMINKGITITIWGAERC
jgi:hypothetical protein